MIPLVGDLAFFSDDENLAQKTDFIFEKAFEKSVIVNLPSQVYSNVTNWIVNNNLIDLGAEAVVNTKENLLTDRVKSLTEGKGVQACFESVGGDIGTQAIASLGKDATMLIYGLMSGEEAKISYGPTIFRTPTIKGFWLSRWMEESSVVDKAKVAKQVYTIMQQGDVTLDVEKIFPLAQAAEAVTYSTQSGRRGKVVIQCG